MDSGARHRRCSTSRAGTVAIERQLAHQEPNDIQAAYNYVNHLPQRRKMMQAWAPYLYGCVRRARRDASKGRPGLHAKA